MSGEVSFIEFGAADAMTARSFYGKLFGWSFEPGPSGGGGYAIDGAGVPAGVHGGDEGAAPYVFFRVDDLDAAAAMVEKLGGTVEELPGADEASAAVFGEFRLCRDDQGSPFGLHRPPRA